MAVTRTLHPLPFQHLEPKRFEDLVRQIAYDFRNWRSLEALGQAGSDGGFDARAFEVLDPTDNDAESDEGEPSVAAERIWLIQCKREESIGPKKLIQYLDQIPPASLAGLHGIVIAAPTKFSKSTSDQFKAWCRERGVQECYLWGRPEIEDALYQPKNDHLLFAYFGISLQVRKRQQTSTLKRTIALKRTLQKHFPKAGLFGKPGLLRDPSDDRYPDASGERFESDKPLWLPTFILGLNHMGLAVASKRFLSYYDYESGTWDFASRINQAIPFEGDNPWYAQQMPTSDQELDAELTEVWRKLPGGRRHHLVFVGFIPYEEILAVDDVGDESLRVPTLFANFRDGVPPFRKQFQLSFLPADGWSGATPFHTTGHVRVFEDRFRDVAWERGWFERNGIEYSTELLTLEGDEKPG